MPLPWPDSATLRHLDQILSRPSGRRLGVLGLGVVGQEMAVHLAQRGARVLGADRRSELNIEVAQRLREAGVEVRLAATGSETFDGVEALAISPGVHPAQPAVRAALARHIPVFGELELCGHLPAPAIAITGTNGKSTTTSLVGALLRGLGREVFVGGNLGDPVLAWVSRGASADVVVLELSSFQLETAYRFSAQVAVVLNVTPDHMDRYRDIEEYARTKRHLVECVPADGVAVLNHDDPQVRSMAASCRGRVFWFSTRRKLTEGSGAYLRDDEAVFCGELDNWRPFPLSHCRLFGRHNRENALAALLAVRALELPDATFAQPVPGRAPKNQAKSVQSFRRVGVSTDDRRTLERAYAAFSGLEHRLELVGDVEGIRWVNDSKATNDESAAMAVLGMDRPTVLLLGGRDKGAGYANVAQAAQGIVRLVIAYGEARETIETELGAKLPCRRCDGFEEALQCAAAEARTGEVVLLAPACSSFDEFENFSERGRRFKAFVQDLERGGWI